MFLLINGIGNLIPWIIGIVVIGYFDTAYEFSSFPFWNQSTANSATVAPIVSAPYVPFTISWTYLELLSN